MHVSLTFLLLSQLLLLYLHNQTKVQRGDGWVGEDGVEGEWEYV